MKRWLWLSLLLFLSPLTAKAQPVLIFPTGAGSATADGSSQYVDLSGMSKVAIHIEYDTGVTGNVAFECTLHTGDTPSNCGSDTIPFSGITNLAATYIAVDTLGQVRVTFSSLAGTDSTHKVRASIISGR